MVDLGEGEWLEANRVQWDERVPLHLASTFYDQTALRAGSGALYPIEEAELAALFPKGLAGKRVLHLQCHFGMDSLALAQRGAEVVGVDFSTPAILAARALASDLGINARFVNANIYDLRHTLPEPESFDLIFTTWGTIVWLPDIVEWARIIAWYLKPGGRFYFADGHPGAQVFDYEIAGESLTPRYAWNSDGVPDVSENDGDYAVEGSVLEHTTSFEWTHPIGSIVTSLVDAGLAIDFVHEHAEVPWKMFSVLEPGADQLFRWPGQSLLPLSVSVAATAR